MSRPLRLVWVGGEPTPYRTPHLEALAAHPDVELRVVYPARTIQGRAWSLPEEAANATYLRGPSLPFSRVLHHDYPLTPGIVPLLERGRFDVVVVSGWALMATQLAVLWCRVRRTPYLLAADSHGAEPRAGWLRAAKRAALPPFVAGAAGWLPAGSLAAAYLESYGARPERTVVFPLTVDVERLAARAEALRPRRAALRERLGVAPEEVAVLQVGRLIPFKAPDLLVRAVAAAADRTPRPLHLVLVGDGPLGPSVSALARELGVRVTLTGLLEGDDLVGAYVAADVLALASRRETWGVVVNEAMACGLPLVLTSRVGAAADLLHPGVNGELVDPDDPDALARALARLAGDDALRERYGRGSRELIAPWGYAENVAAVVCLAHGVVRDGRRSRRTTPGAAR